MVLVMFENDCSFLKAVFFSTWTLLALLTLVSVAGLSHLVLQSILTLVSASSLSNLCTDRKLKQTSPSGDEDAERSLQAQGLLDVFKPSVIH